MPTLEQLVGIHRVDLELAMHLSRPVFTHELRKAVDAEVGFLLYSVTAFCCITMSHCCKG